MSRPRKTIGQRLAGKIARGPLSRLTAKLMSREIRNFENKLGREELLDYCWWRGGGTIRPGQVRWEIESLLRHVFDTTGKRRILEIGTNKGGTLFLSAQLAANDATIISLDLPAGPFGGGYKAWRIPLYESFAKPKQKMILIRGDSQSEDSFQQVVKHFDEPIDYLFIDGDHTYDGVKADFEKYSPLVKKGGHIAFHDIASHTTPNCQVDQFWQEIREKYQHQEFIGHPEQGWAGIGVLTWPGHS